MFGVVVASADDTVID
jgi:hypothetical protein